MEETFDYGIDINKFGIVLFPENDVMEEKILFPVKMSKSEFVNAMLAARNMN
jgi:hypothetical protein